MGWLYSTAADFPDTFLKSPISADHDYRDQLVSGGRPPQMVDMTFWQFLIFFGLAVFVLWNIWIAIRSLGDIGDDD